MNGLKVTLMIYNNRTSPLVLLTIYKIKRLDFLNRVTLFHPLKHCLNSIMVYYGVVSSWSEIKKGSFWLHRMNIWLFYTWLLLRTFQVGGSEKKTDILGIIQDQNLIFILPGSFCKFQAEFGSRQGRCQRCPDFLEMSALDIGFKEYMMLKIAGVRLQRKIFKYSNVFKMYISHKYVFVFNQMQITRLPHCGSFTFDRLESVLNWLKMMAHLLFAL